MCEKFRQLLAVGRWFPLGTPVSPLKNSWIRPFLMCYLSYSAVPAVGGWGCLFSGGVLSNHPVTMPTISDWLRQWGWWQCWWCFRFLKDLFGYHGSADHYDGWRGVDLSPPHGPHPPPPKVSGTPEACYSSPRLSPSPPVLELYGSRRKQVHLHHEPSTPRLQSLRESGFNNSTSCFRTWTVSDAALVWRTSCQVDPWASYIMLHWGRPSLKSWCKPLRQRWRKLQRKASPRLVQNGNYWSCTYEIMMFYVNSRNCAWTLVIP